jgi:hypothetical protein
MNQMRGACSCIECISSLYESVGGSDCSMGNFNAQHSLPTGSCRRPWSAKIDALSRSQPNSSNQPKAKEADRAVIRRKLHKMFSVFLWI